ncbi:M23 family metallopeptidase [Sphingobacterium oryzagri]|uniref:M23 family metallopeptidase n=1 Tax=Sphingobacterium oryzagri TaxID=3025669 RepID=A0ABY7WDB3_9SPHI|nr:M23 family metallopeptidase [Sphingobacterium sp. KACC 22765]WDF67487.1 M23 family metallopeptidase [Sphingobacterium sp. KACC 22765]
MRYLPIFILFIFLLQACQRIRPLLQRTERGKYESSFRKDDSLFNRWKSAHDQAMAAPLTIALPYQATLQIADVAASALVYQIAVKQGQRLVAELSTLSDSSRIFLEFFDGHAFSNKKLLAERSDLSNEVNWSANRDDSVRVSLQPLLHDSAVYHLKIYAQPAYHFPVLGKDNRAIQSFWGADRDGGARRHEGIDIFATRGTPVLAVADGHVGFAGERGRLGGKQVWLQEKELGFRIYYAHLDSTSVYTGDAVALGDTLGFVGNTGNAAGGPPHLHFGVYGSGGAVDPLNFVKKITVPSGRTYSFNMKQIRVTKNTQLRQGPDVTYPARLQLQAGEDIKVLARTGNWWHVMARDSIPGFVFQ